MGYLVWPLALADLLREGPSAAAWSRIHTRQALTFGLLSSLTYVVILALPLIIVIATPAMSTSTTLFVYGLGIALDVIAAIVALVLAFGFANRAGRGELFRIPLVSRFVDLASRGVR